MTQNTSAVRRMGILVMLAILGSVSGVAQAGDWSRHHHSSTCGHSYTQYAGRITIDGYSTRIRSGRGLLKQVASAFRRAGYPAWIEDGRVWIDYGGCRPEIHWRAEGYGIRLNWSRGELGVSLRRSYRQSHYDGYRPRRIVRPVRRSFRFGYCD